MTVKRVSPEEAKALLDEEGYVYVDVCSVPEFEAGHPAGAYNVPLLNMTPGGMRPNAEFMDVVLAAFPKEVKLVIGCRTGNRSLRAAQLLMQAGYSEVVDQRAGLEGVRDPFGQLQEAGWQRLGFEVSMEAQPGHSYEELKGSRADD